MIQVGLSMAAIIISLTFALLLLKKKQSDRWVILLLMMIVCLLESFDLLALLNAERCMAWKGLSLSAEAFLPVVCLFFGYISSREAEQKKLRLSQLILLILSCIFPLSVFLIPVTVFIYSPDLVADKMIFLLPPGLLFYSALVAYLVLALASLEHTLASACGRSRWKIKIEILGAGLILTYLVFYYSQAILYRTLDMHNIAGRSVVIILAVLMMAYSRFVRGNVTRISVSREFAGRSVAISAFSIYLILLIWLGQGMRHFGDGFHRSIILSLEISLGIGLLACLLSETVKRKIRMYINRHFYENKYDYKAEWLQFTACLSSTTKVNELAGSILSFYLETFGMGRGALYLNDQERKSFRPVSILHMEGEVTELKFNGGLVPLPANSKALHIVCEGTSLAGIPPLVVRENQISFIVPLLTDNTMVGLILLGKPVDRGETYDQEDLELMETLAHQAASAILIAMLSEQLASAREMEAMGKISAFVVHDLKNLVYAVSLILDNMDEYMVEPEFQRDMVESLANTVAKMKILITKLKNVPEKCCLHREPSDLLQLVNDTLRCMGGNFSITGKNVVAMVDREELQKVAMNLVLNAIEASEGDGTVDIEVGSQGQAFIRVLDRGCGIEPDFMQENLFSPFKTTKKKGLGIGLYQCKQIVEAHSGKIEVSSTVGTGTEFTVWLPKA